MKVVGDQIEASGSQCVIFLYLVCHTINVYYILKSISSPFYTLAQSKSQKNCSMFSGLLYGRVGILTEVSLDYVLCTKDGCL
jgi:hypothetical protein